MKRIIIVLTIVSLLLLSQNTFFIQRGYCSYPVQSDYYEVEEEEEPDEDEEERKEREELEEAIHESTDTERDYYYY